MDVLPRPSGSQAKPTRGAKFTASALATCLPNGELVPLMMMPFNGSKFGLGVPPPAQGKTVQMFPLLSMVGALAGSYFSGSKLVKELLASAGCPKWDRRMP